MRLRFAAVEQRTGNVIDYLTDLSFQGALKKTIGRYETVQCELTIGDRDRPPPQNWLRATLHGGAAIVALDPVTNTPLWGGLVAQRNRTEGDTVQLGLVTAEAYLAGRMVGTVSYTGQDQNFIAADLVNRFVLDGAGGKPGLPIRVQYATGTTTRSEAYFDYNDTTVYSALQSLMGLLGGPEWTIEWEWQHNPERLTPVLYVGGAGGDYRLGTRTPAGLNSPNVVFSMPGCVKAFTLAEDYTSGKGANSVMATSSGNGLARPQAISSMTDADRPTYEYRFSPQQNLLVNLTLQQYADQALSVIGNGTTAVSLDADYGTAPKLNVDWRTGDDLGYRIGGLDKDGNDIVPAFPGGITGTARSVGFSLTDEDTPALSPILYQPVVYTGS